MRLRLKGLKLLALFLTISACGSAQDSASIAGTVTNPSGASIPEAKITVQNLEHGIHRLTSTNTSGEFFSARSASGALQPFDLGARIQEISGQGDNSAGGAECPRRCDPASRQRV